MKRWGSYGALEARLARLEKRAAGKPKAGEPDPNQVLIDRVQEMNKRKLLPNDRRVANAFTSWFAEKFVALRSSDQDELLVGVTGFFDLSPLQEGVFYQAAKEEFREFLTAACPDRPPLESDLKTFEFEISEIARRMYIELATNLVPARARQYYFDPDKFLSNTFRRDLFDPPRKFCVITLKVLRRPPGNLIKRARAFTKIHARREDDGDEWMALWKTGDTEPVDSWAHRYTNFESLRSKTPTIDKGPRSFVEFKKWFAQQLGGNE